MELAGELNAEIYERLPEAGVEIADLQSGVYLG